MSVSCLHAVTEGTYYCPTSKRHGSAVVICDMCGARPLLACISCAEIDVCLTCAAELLAEERDRVEKEKAEKMVRVYDGIGHAHAGMDVPERLVGKTLTSVRSTYPHKWIRVHDGGAMTCEYVIERWNVEVDGDVIAAAWCG